MRYDDNLTNEVVITPLFRRFVRGVLKKGLKHHEIDGFVYRFKLNEIKRI